jgi:trigger factor
MQVSVSTTGLLGRRVEVAVPATEIAQAVEERLKQLSRTTRLKGFRPGKVPFAIVRQQFGDAVHAEVVSEKMRTSLGAALDQQKLRPAAGPRIEPIATEPGGDLKYAAVFEVLPEVKVNDPATLKLERDVAEVSEADIDAMINSMRRQRVTYREHAGEARESDRVLIDFDGRIDGAPFEGGAGQDVEIILGAGQAAQQLDQGLRGAVAGDQRTVSLTFPPTHPTKAIAGKTAELQVTVKRVDEPTLPEVDEEFCRAYGVEEGTVEALRREVRKSMEQELEGVIQSRLRQQVIDALHRENPVEVPRSMVEVEMRRLQADAGRRMGVKDAAKLPPIEQFRAQAQRRTALSLVLGQIVQNERMQPDAQRVKERLDEEASVYQDPERARAALGSSKEVMDQLVSAVLEGQVVDWVVARAQITDQPRTFSEVTGFGREQRSDDKPENAT